MRRSSLFLVAAIIAAFSFLALSVEAVQPDVSPMVNGFPVPDLNAGFLNTSTPTFTVGMTNKVDIGTNLPQKTAGFRAHAYGGAMVLGPSSSLATSPYIVGVEIASGSYMDWTGIASSSPNIRALSTTGTGTITIAPWGFPQ